MLINYESILIMLYTTNNNNTSRLFSTILCHKNDLLNYDHLLTASFKNDLHK